MNTMLKALVVVTTLLAPAAAFADKDFMGADDGATWDCSQDAKVNINYGDGTFTFTGACEEINVNGSNVKITADDVATTNINGAKNVVKTNVLGAANINGTGNKVTYKKVKTGKKVKVTSNGTGNSVKKVTK